MNNKEIKIPCMKLCSKTLCGECRWLDFSQPTKSEPVYYFCKRVGGYKDPNLNTACTHWNEED